MIPFCAGRVGGGLDQLGSRSDDPDDAGALRRLRRRPIDYFKMFYGDTALFGAWHAMESGLAFFGADHVLFGTDMPFDPEKGPGSSATPSPRWSGCGRRRRKRQRLRGECL